MYWFKQFHFKHVACAGCNLNERLLFKFVFFSSCRAKYFRGKKLNGEYEIRVEQVRNFFTLFVVEEYSNY